MDTACAVEQVKNKLGPASETRPSAVLTDEHVCPTVWHSQSSQIVKGVYIKGSER